MNVPRTTRMNARPVWQRHLRRAHSNTQPLPPPTEEEQQDAIRVLEDPSNEGEPGLWREAHLIFMEASEQPESRRVEAPGGDDET